MHLKFFSGFGGTIGEGGAFNFEAGDIVDFSHDVADAKRIVAAGRAEEVGPLRVAEATAAGRRVLKHPLADAARRK